jgi:NADH dehydrogenase/NADH:ubiquinone oxidoreductase subunit G
MQRCVQVADQLTDNRVRVLDRGDHANISTCILRLDNEFSGNMIDVCPVGA